MITVAIFQFRCYSQNEDFYRLNYSVEQGIALLKAFEGYFEIDYPLPKVGMYISSVAYTSPLLLSSTEYRPIRHEAFEHNFEIEYRLSKAGINFMYVHLNELNDGAADRLFGNPLQKKKTGLYFYL